MSREENDICRDYYLKISMEPTLPATETLTESGRKKTRKIERRDKERERERERERDKHTNTRTCLRRIRPLLGRRNRHCTQCTA